MKQISTHISYLLLNCRSVTVPGLGTFSACYESASFDPYDSVFYPQRIRIEFSSQEIPGQSLLIKSLERKNGWEGTKTLLEDFVKKVHTCLNVNGYCRLEGIGYLIKNNETLALKDTFWKRNKFSTLHTVRV